MKIKNNADVATYMGYAEVGFTLQAGETSHELPLSLLENKFLLADRNSGLIDVILADSEKNGIVLEPITKSVISEVSASLQTIITAPAIPQASPSDIIEIEVKGQLARIASREDKIAYLESLKKEGNGRAIKLADKLLKQFEVESKPAPVSPAPKLEDPQPPVSNADTSTKTDAAQISLGRPGEQPYAPEGAEAGDDLDKMNTPALMATALRMGITLEHPQGPSYKPEALRELIRDARNPKPKTAKTAKK